jgi:hypothetical protein
VDAPDHVRVVTSRYGKWVSALRPSVILALVWLGFVLFAYPGLMSMDSFDQLEEARAHFYTDSHPPAMAALWSVVDRIVPGPFAMLVIQSIAFLAGLNWLLRRVLSPWRAAICAAVLFVFPPVFAPLVVIWKDCLMAGFLLLGTAAITDARRGVRIAGLVGFLIATAMRYNAFAATLPLTLILFEWEQGKRWLVRYAIALGAWLAITLLAFALNAALTDRKMYFWYSTFALADMAGTLANVDGTIADDELRPLLAPTQIKIDSGYHDALRSRYRPETFTQLIGGDTALWTVPIRGIDPAPVEQRDAIGHAWWQILTGHPGAFVRYRFQVFHQVLGLPDKFAGGSLIRRHWQTPERLQAMGIESHTSWFQKGVERWIVRLANYTSVFRPYVYFFLAFALLWFARRYRLVLAILASGLVMELSLLALAATPDYRYSHWMIVCTCLSVVMLIAQRSRETT